LDSPHELDDVEDHEDNAILDLLVDERRVPVGGVGGPDCDELPDTEHHQSEAKDDEDGQIDEEDEFIFKELVGLAQENSTQFDLLSIAKEEDSECYSH
jgi:hypothetical protein